MCDSREQFLKGGWTGQERLTDRKLSTRIEYIEKSALFNDPQIYSLDVGEFYDSGLLREQKAGHGKFSL
jgi:hypothetical protein